MKNNQQEKAQSGLEYTNDVPPIEISREIELEPKELIVGSVVNCISLNVREEPNGGSAICGFLRAGTDVVIQENLSNEDFYKISTSDGIEGYCMKKYIAVRT